MKCQLSITPLCGTPEALLFDLSGYGSSRCVCMHRDTNNYPSNTKLTIKINYQLHVSATLRRPQAIYSCSEAYAASYSTCTRVLSRR